MSQPHESERWRNRLRRYDARLADQPPSLMAHQVLLRHGETDASLQVIECLLERDPRNQDLLFHYTNLLSRLGRRSAAEPYLHRLHQLIAEELEIAPQDAPDVEGFLAAADHMGRQPSKAPDAYVRALFDNYAEDFDQKLRDKLGYRGPEHLLDLLAPRLPAGRMATALDLGCGTGLCGQVLGQRVRRMDGVDLSPLMIDKARAKGCYQALVVGDAQQVLAASTEALLARYDLILAADVLVYIGDPAPMLTAARARLGENGLIGFTVESIEDEELDGETAMRGYRLQNHCRYAHVPDALQRLAETLGYRVLASESRTLRTERDRPVVSRVVVLGI